MSSSDSLHLTQHLQQSHRLLMTLTAEILSKIFEFLRSYLSEYSDSQNHSPQTSLLMEILISSLLELLGDLCFLNPEVVRESLVEVLDPPIPSPHYSLSSSFLCCALLSNLQMVPHFSTREEVTCLFVIPLLTKLP
jgi:hypothetical protein